MAAIFIVSMSPLIVYAQTSFIPLPAGTLEGRLPNGLRYLILRNSSPASRIEFRLVMEVGSVQETEQEKGCAHFLEHVAFGGTTHFPKRSLVEYLESLGMKVYRHYSIPGYPSNIPFIVSDEGYGKNDYIETTRSLVVVTAPGPGSGKMATCLSQLYHEYKRGIKAGYAKYETFPIWNIPLKHPVNLAYEAATADLNDVNMIDPFHLEAYGETTINYNRDVEIFPVVSAMFEKIMGSCPYKSPTDMGVNMAGFGIVDDEAVRDAAKQEIIRRYYHTLCQKRQGTASDDQILKLELLMKQAGVTIDDRAVVSAANIKAETTGEPAAAIQLPDGRVLTGRTSTLLGASSALLLNALKALAGIPDEVQLISPTAIGPIQDLKTNYLGNRNPRLHTDETLIALSICAATDDTAKAAVEQLKNLKGSEVHSSVILSQIDMNTFRKLGVNLTCEPHYQNQKLYHN